jgi:hypothetical protein
MWLAIVLVVLLRIFTVNFVSQKGNDVIQDRLPDISGKIWPIFFQNIILIIPFLAGWSVASEFFNYYVVIIAVRTVFKIVTRHKNCDDSLHYDKIFSGHFSYVFLISIILYKHGIFTNVPLLALFNTLYALLIIAMRSHYTVDILVAIPVILTLYQNKINFTSVV